MAKVNVIKQNFDEELAAQGKRRIMEAVPVTRADGEVVLCYKEKVVNAESIIPTGLLKPVKKPLPKKVARKGTNLERVVEFVKTTELKGKPEMVKGIVEMLNVTEANAKVYLYKASQLI